MKILSCLLLTICISCQNNTTNSIDDCEIYKVTIDYMLKKYDSYYKSETVYFFNDYELVNSTVPNKPQRLQKELDELYDNYKRVNKISRTSNELNCIKKSNSRIKITYDDQLFRKDENIKLIVQKPLVQGEYGCIIIGYHIKRLVSNSVLIFFEKTEDTYRIVDSYELYTI